ncbi:MAG: dihydrodipicolinate synthase family protein [Beijerinckiaceae bacterium]
MNRPRFSGVYPILYAFWTRDGKLDHAAMRIQVEHCIAEGAHGVAVLGLVTEVNRMTTEERREAVACVGEAIAGRTPYAVTIGEPDAERQIEFTGFAKDHGASWVILQPPPGAGHSEIELQRHFGRIADSIDLPAAIQNNPINLASSLSPEGLAAVVKAHRNISLLKAEGWSVDIAQVIKALDGNVDAFGGHGGAEFISLMRSGGAGLIPAPDCLALQVAMFEALTSGDRARIAAAERAHKEILPLVTFMTRSIPGLLCYGKRVMAKRLGLTEIYDRQPALAPTAFGLTEMERLFTDVVSTEARELAAIRGAATHLA